MSRPRRVLGYARVSGAEQGRTGTSLEAQREEIVRYCAAHNYPTPDIRVEVESAGAEKLDRRRILQGLIRDAAAGDLVIVSKQDRWSRDTLFYLKSVRDLEERGVRFFSIAERFDPATPEGRFAATIMAAVAEQERARTRQRTVVRRKELRDKGLYIEGLPPLGYRRVRGGIIEPTRDAPVIVAMFRRCARGDSLRRITLWLEEEHPRLRRDRQVIRKMLHNRVYLGEVLSSDGKWIDGQHKGIVPRDLFDRAQVSIQHRHLGGKPFSDNARTAKWLLRGIASCALCGARIGPAYGKDRKDNYIDYYACAKRTATRECACGYARVERVDAFVAAAALDRLRELRDELGGCAPEDKKAPDFAAKRQRIEAKRERIIDMGADGTISRQEVKRRLERAENDMATLDEQERAYRAEHRARRPSVRAGLLRDVEQLEKAWKRASVARRRRILQQLAVSIALEGAAEPVVSWRSLEELCEQANW